MNTGRYHWRIILAVLLVVVITGGVAARIYLPTWTKEYLNNVLANLKGYDGSIEDIDIHLYRGAYTIHGLKIVKTGTGMPVPFVKMDSADISVEWKALLHGRIVSEIKVHGMDLNFAVNQSGQHQTGTEADWTEAIKKLTPTDINRITIDGGKIAYRNFSTEPQVNIYMTGIEGEVTNLRNVEDKDAALPSTIRLSGKSIGNGRMSITGRMNVLRAVPDVDLDAKLESVNLPALNDYFRAFAAIDVEKGEFDLYTEIKTKNGNVTGYVKPIARHIHLIDLNRDSNPIKLLWESIASVVIEVFSNQRKDQFATRVPLRGNIDHIKTDPWAALGGILRNAFVEAFHKGFDSKEKTLRPTQE